VAPIVAWVELRMKCWIISTSYWMTTNTRTALLETDGSYIWTNSTRWLHARHCYSVLPPLLRGTEEDTVFR
jgi:hypothetical protein